jgi:hypothetical protein
MPLPDEFAFIAGSRTLYCKPAFYRKIIAINKKPAHPKAVSVK